MELIHLDIDSSSPFPADFDPFDHATEETKLNCTNSLDDLYLGGKLFIETFFQLSIAF